jgi:hypothetical protein
MRVTLRAVVRPGLERRARCDRTDPRAEIVEPREDALLVRAHTIGLRAAPYFGFAAAGLHGRAVGVRIDFEVILARAAQENGRVGCLDLDRFALGQGSHADRRGSR